MVNDCGMAACLSLAFLAPSRGPHVPWFPQESPAAKLLPRSRGISGGKGIKALKAVALPPTEIELKKPAPLCTVVKLSVWVPFPWNL